MNRNWVNDRGYTVRLAGDTHQGFSVTIRQGWEGYAPHVYYRHYPYWEESRAVLDAELHADLGQCEEVFHARVA